MPKVIFWDNEKHFYKQLYEFWFEIIIILLYPFLRYTQKLLNGSSSWCQKWFSETTKNIFINSYMNSDLKLLLSCYIHFCDIRQSCWMLAKVDAKNDFLRQRKTFLQTIIWILIWNYYYLVISIFAIYAKIVEC